MNKKDQGWFCTHAKVVSETNRVAHSIYWSWKCDECGERFEPVKVGESTTLPPAHRAVPDVELEALRRAIANSRTRFRDELMDELGADIRQSADAIIAHLPPKVDHVARLEKLRDTDLFSECADIRAALDFAIDTIRRSKP